ncbi:dephospho-CoA kinase [Saccharicrinis sp. GN24d3]|uniref:dephospho-CoA kinase n=1 Tax=Saccharicrinis sp. GN24d3 TaxID=3458416 RepID=UPI004036FB80
MIKVGVTGGIGSGKTTVCNIFKTLNVPVYSADQEARYLTDSHPDIIAGVKALFGADIYVNGQLDRKKVGSLVFANKELLTGLNNIVHPVVARHFKDWLAHNQHHPYILKEAAILFESGANKHVDKVIMVTAPRDIRVRRVMRRDNFTEKEVIGRMNNQMSEKEKVSWSDYVIRCNDKELVIPQVLEIHKSLLRQ